MLVGTGYERTPMPDSTPSILGTIFSEMDRFSASERRIAEYVLENQDAITINQATLAEATNTSPATVSRFCRKVGTKSFREFQTILYGEILMGHGANGLALKEVSLDDVAGSLDLILTNKSDEVKAMAQNLPVSTIEGIAGVLLKANRVLVAGIGKTMPCAIDATYKLSLVGVRAETSQIYESMLASALTLTAGDVVLFISASGFCPRLLRVAAGAHERGATVIVITGNGESQMAKTADILLVTTNREKALNRTFGYSITNFMVVNEILYLLLANQEIATRSVEDNLRFQLGRDLARGD